MFFLQLCWEKSNLIFLLPFLLILQHQFPMLGLPSSLFTFLCHQVKAGASSDSSFGCKVLQVVLGVAGSPQFLYGQVGPVSDCLLHFPPSPLNWNAFGCPKGEGRLGSLNGGGKKKKDFYIHQKNLFFFFFSQRSHPSVFMIKLSLPVQPPCPKQGLLVKFSYTGWQASVFDHLGSP